MEAHKYVLLRYALVKAISASFRNRRVCDATYIIIFKPTWAKIVSLQVNTGALVREHIFTGVEDTGL